MRSRPQKNAFKTASASRPPESDRRRQLVQIAFDHIATKGFEGLRFQEVAKEAGINNATLYYHFPSKEALIGGVVDFLRERLESPVAPPKTPPRNALEELRQEFEDTRHRLAQSPSFFIVITELALRAKRDLVVDKIGKQRDDFWARRLSAIVERGLAEGIFRPDLDVHATVASLMTQFKGISHHATMRKRKPGEIDLIVSEIAAQVEHWLTCPAPRPATG